MRVGGGPYQSLDWLYEIRNGRAFARGTLASAVAGQNSHCQLWNPVGSLITIFLYEALVAPGAVGVVLFSTYNTVFGTAAGPGHNLKSGGADSVGETRSTTNAGNLGSDVLRPTMPAGQTSTFGQPWLIVLGAGQGCVAVHQVVNTALDTTFKWVER